MSSSTAKRVILYRFDRQPLEGIVNPCSYLLQDHVELITLDGNLQSPTYTDIKALCFTSEKGRADLFIDHNFFERRPKIAGLWTRFTFRDGDRLDGVLPHNLLDWPQTGYLVTPPRAGAARQRVFVPRAAIISTELHGVVGAPRSARSRDRKKAAAAGDIAQLTMFESS